MVDAASTACRFSKGVTLSCVASKRSAGRGVGNASATAASFCRTRSNWPRVGGGGTDEEEEEEEDDEEDDDDEECNAEEEDGRECSALSNPSISNPLTRW